MIEIVRTIVEDDKSLLLRRRGPHLELVLGNVVLLSSAALETENTFGRLGDPSVPGKVLVGGLGFGATLRAALERVGPSGRVVVVEKLRTVVDVARTEAKDLVGDALDDPRTDLVVGDVADVIAASAPATYSAILLDVDNGPEWASFRTNARLYADAALVRARAALAPGGTFAVWAGYPADSFVATLRRAGFRPSIVPLEERGVVRARAYVGLKPTP